MASISLIRTSNGNGPAAMATVQQQRSSASLIFDVDTVANFNESGFIATAGTPTNVPLATGENLLVIANPTVFKGHVDGGNVIIDSIVDGYSDNGNNIGDVIIIKPTSAWGDEVADLLAVSLNDDGSINSTAIDQIAASLSGKSVRLRPRSLVDDTQTTLTPNIDDYNCYELTDQASNLTIAAPTGTPEEFDVLVVRVKPVGSARTLSLASSYVNVSGVDTPTSLPVGKWCYLGAVWNSGAEKWQVVSITQEA